MSWKKPNGEDDNVVSLEDHKKAKESTPSDQSEYKEPLINLPMGTKAFVGLFILIHVGLWGVSQLSDDNMLFVHRSAKLTS